MKSVESCDEEIKTLLVTSILGFGEEGEPVKSDPIDLLDEECVEKLIKPISQEVTELGTYIHINTKDYLGKKKVLKHAKERYGFYNRSCEKTQHVIESECKILMKDILKPISLRDMQHELYLCQKIGREIEQKILIPAGA